MNTKTGVANATYRITWIEGKAHLQRCPLGGLWDHDGEVLRPATDADQRDIYEQRRRPLGGRVAKFVKGNPYCFDPCRWIAPHASFSWVGEGL